MGGRVDDNGELEEEAEEEEKEEEEEEEEEWGVGWWVETSTVSS